MVRQSVELRVVVTWDDQIAKKLTPAAVPGLAEAYLQQGFVDAFATADHTDPTLGRVPIGHGPGCICGCQQAVYAEVIT